MCMYMYYNWEFLGVLLCSRDMYMYILFSRNNIYTVISRNNMYTSQLSADGSSRPFKLFAFCKPYCIQTVKHLAAAGHYLTI